jgi:sugar O-acyltransferase (sialic acid O-acetyltransferase NeuD family)
VSVRLLILGAGGHGKVSADCAAEQGRWSAIEFFDDRWPGLGACAHWAVVGNGADLANRPAASGEAFVAIGGAEARLAWIARIQEAGLALASIVHPRAVVSAGASVASGVLVVAGAVINIGARLDEGVIVNTGATVDHDCIIEAGAHICPGAHLAGNVAVGRGAWVGLGAAVRQGVKIGAGATIGAGAVVIDDIPPGVTAVGAPARPTKKKEDGAQC